jgi:hypothetical protein
VKAGSVVVETWRLGLDELISILRVLAGESRVGFLTKPSIIQVKVGNGVVYVAVPQFSLVVVGDEASSLSQSLLGDRRAYILEGDTWLDLKWVEAGSLLALLEGLVECTRGSRCGRVGLDTRVDVYLELTNEKCERVLTTGFYTAPYHYVVEASHGDYGFEPGLTSYPGGGRLIELFYGGRVSIRLKIPHGCRRFETALLIGLLDALLYVLEG